MKKALILTGIISVTLLFAFLLMACGGDDSSGVEEWGQPFDIANTYWTGQATVKTEDGSITFNLELNIYDDDTYYLNVVHYTTRSGNFMKLNGTMNTYQLFWSTYIVGTAMVTSETTLHVSLNSSTEEMQGEYDFILSY